MRPPPDWKASPDARAVVADWFDRHVDSIYGYVARRVGEHIARDVVSETFRVALERFDQFDGARGGERAWLFGIATNVLRRHWRTEERRLRTCAAVAGSPDVTGDPLVAVEEAVDAQRRLARLVDAVCSLSSDDRDLLVLTAWEGMSSVETASVMGVPAGTVRSRLNRIRTQLRFDEALIERGEVEHG
jgi:RNA polymerase sigma-70 factor (ECF subfamily)